MATVGRLLTAMITPMKEDGSVDMGQVARLATALLESGSDGLVVCWTTGESPTLEFEEERDLFKEILPICKSHDATLIAGTGSNSTRTAINASRNAEEIGVDALLLVVPYYNKPSQNGLYQHFRAIAESVSIPCILYNVPSRTATNMSADTQVQLAHEVPNIIGTKEASGDLDQMGAIIAHAPDDFIVWSGDDALTLPLLAVGGYGVISVVSHIVGRQLRLMIDSQVSGETEVAAGIHRSLLPLIKSMFLVGNPAPIKYALNYLGFQVGPTRMPLVEPSEEIKTIIHKELASVKIDLSLLTK